MTSVRTAYAIIADDLTGAGDAGVQFAAAGLRTRTLRDDWTPESLAGAEVVVVDTASRGLAAEQAYRRVAAAAARLQAAATQVVYKKIDSTLRGPLGAEIDAVLDACGLNLALVCPAYPANGRTLQDGVLLVGGIPVAETPAAADPHGAGTGEPPSYTAQAPGAPHRAVAAPALFGPYTRHPHCGAARAGGRPAGGRCSCGMRCTG